MGKPKLNICSPVVRVVVVVVTKPREYVKEDEAEAALKRALVIDPRYTIAKMNLRALPETRRTGPPKMIGINEPFRDSKLKQSITFIQEK